LKPITLTDLPQTQPDLDRQSAVKSGGPIPRHIAVIMDGNGRWAKNRGYMRIFGHQAGVDSVRDITEACAQLGVEYLTLYTFSTENWGRPSEEVGALMQILVQSLRKETQRLNENDICLNAIGQITRFPDVCQRELREAIELTRDNTRLRLNLALSYSGRWDITQAVRKLARRVADGDLNPEEISDAHITAELVTAGIPDPDLIIRTSGEQRISNFLLWQLAYSELYITQTLWPDFRRDELYQAIQSYQSRERRFGTVAEPVAPTN
jgi:undecaprenyl diphosphate synthase